jgi:hypothetical protein
MVALIPPLLATTWIVAAGTGAANPVFPWVGGYFALVLLISLASSIIEYARPANTDGKLPIAAQNRFCGGTAMLPEFTPEEQYLIAYYKSGYEESISDWLGGEAAYLLAVAIMLAMAFYVDSIVLAASASVVYAMLKLRESIHGPRWKRLMRSILQKYEAELTRQTVPAASSATPLNP